MNQDNNSNLTPRHIEDDSIDLKKYFFAILANWYWFVISLFITLGIAWLFNRYTMPVYQVTGSLIINEDSRGKGLSGYENLIPGMEIFRSQKTLLTEIEILKSETLADRTLSRLDFGITYMGVGRTGIKESLLYNSCPFVVIPDSDKYNLYGYPVYIEILDKNYYEVNIDGQYNISQKLAFGEPFHSDVFNFTLELVDSAGFSPKLGYNKYYFILQSHNALVNNFRRRLNINTNDEKRGSVLFLSVFGNNPYQITDYLNTLMDVYIQKGLEEKNQTAINTVNFIDEQLGVIDTSLRVAELNLQDFRLKNRLIDLSIEGSMAYSRLESLQNEKAMAELKNRYFDYINEYVKNRNNLNQIVAPTTIDIRDPLLASLIDELNAFLNEKAGLLFTVQQENPKIKQLDIKIETTRQALLDIIDNMRKTNEINIDEIDRQMEKANAELSRLPATERMLISIQRQYKVNDQIYTYLLQKRAESAIAKASNVSDNRILDYANPNNTILIAPKSRSNYMMSLMIGIALPLALLILLDLMNNKISNRAEIERKTSMPVISNIGHNSESGYIPSFESPKSSIAESFRGLRTNLQYLLREKDQKVISITSTISGEGKTFCACNLASIFAMSGKKTLLIGLDLRRPKIHKIFNLSNSTGISTCLIGKTTLEEVVVPIKIDNLFVAPAGPVPPNPAELLESEAMTELIQKARQQYDIIIFDTPPMGMVTDALILARLTDLNLFVLRQNYSTRNILDLLEDVYQKRELGQMGIVMNDIKHKGYYGYGYRYYNYGYSSRYGYYNTYGVYHE